MDIHLHLAAQIRRHAARRGVPLRQLAQRNGRSQSHLFDVLSGRRSPTVAWLEDIARALRVEPWQLLTRPRG